MAAQVQIRRANFGAAGDDEYTAAYSACSRRLQESVRAGGVQYSPSTVYSICDPEASAAKGRAQALADIAAQTGGGSTTTTRERPATTPPSPGFWDSVGDFFGGLFGGSRTTNVATPAGAVGPGGVLMPQQPATPSWVLPVGIGVGVLAVGALALALRRDRPARR